MSVSGVRLLGKVSGREAEIVSPEALAFVATLHRAFNQRYGHEEMGRRGLQGGCRGRLRGSAAGAGTHPVLLTEGPNACLHLAQADMKAFMSERMRNSMEMVMRGYTAA
eukprot:scaffold95461_cov18-Tisochrysis_lutea.AAC.1